MFNLRRPRAERVTREDRKKYIDDLYNVFLGRSPGVQESDSWVSVLDRGFSEREVFYRFKTSDEYQLRAHVQSAFPAGHYHSPIVDPDEARKYFRVDRRTDPKNLSGIFISIENMVKVWERLRPFVAATRFPEKREEPCRYYMNDDVYPIGDATILRAMILAMKPNRIIEIGSGFSSACMLDALDESSNFEANVTFIEPYAERLLGLLRPSDKQRCKIIEQPVQALDVRLFESLESNDILFIDSTHVLKTGSDVHFELFEILPRLKNGVLIHFHDIHYPFEYPESWIFDQNYSWNEIYALRAFLMYNHEFEVVYFNSFFAAAYRELIEQTYPPMLQNPGGSLWLRKIGGQSQAVLRTDTASIGNRQEHDLARRGGMHSWGRLDPIIEREALSLSVVSAIHPDDHIFRFVMEHPRFDSDEVRVRYYFNEGANSARQFSELLLKYCSHICQKPRVLEFASGFGCVTRHLALDTTIDLASCDIHPAAIDFLQNRIGVRAIQSSPFPEIVDFPHSFDFVFALSFFSHMPITTWTRWLVRLTQCARPGGVVAFTTHGMASKGLFGDLDAGPLGFWFVSDSEQFDLPTEEYGTTVVTETFVRKTVLSIPSVELVETRLGYWWGHQDLYVLRKTA